MTKGCAYEVSLSSIWRNTAQVNLLSSESSTWASSSSAWGEIIVLLKIIRVKCIFSPSIGPGFDSTSPAIISNRDSARKRDKMGVAHTVLPRPCTKHRTSLRRKENTPFPAPHTPVATFSESQSSSRTHTKGASEITLPRCRCSGTCGRNPQCAWYQRSFFFFFFLSIKVCTHVQDIQ